MTLLTLAYAVWTTGRERKQAAEDRVAADKRLTEEREAGDQRLKDERAHEAEMRRRDRQIANIAVLVGRVAEVQALLVPIPGAALRLGQGSQIVKDALAAISSLRHGAWNEAAMLGTGEAPEAAADRYRALVRLVDEASRAQITNSYPERDRNTLRNYAMGADKTGHYRVTVLPGTAFDLGHGNRRRAPAVSAGATTTSTPSISSVRAPSSTDSNIACIVGDGV